MQHAQPFADRTPHSLLTPLQKKMYERDGFLILDRFFDVATCKLLMQRANEIADRFDVENHRTIFSTTTARHTKDTYFLESGNDVRCFLEEQGIAQNGQLLSEKKYCINKIGHALHRKDPLFKLFSQQHKIGLLAQELGLGNAAITQSMYIFKQPHIGGEVLFHQDSTYLYTHGQPIVGFWFALQDATLENGCLWALPGEHKKPLRSRMIRSGNNIQFEHYVKEPFDQTNMIPLEVSAGSVVILHGLLPHMSKQNVSSQSRHAYTLHVMAEGSEFADNNWLQMKKGQSFLRLSD